jgi:hypothetical protein
MTMDSIFYQPGDIVPIPEISQLDRISRLSALGQEDTVAGLLWLAMNFPAVCDAMLDKTEFDAVDDEDPCQEPEPFRAECGADIGVFLRYGTDWRHYFGDVTAGQIEVFDPGHDPVVAWRLPGIPA